MSSFVWENTHRVVNVLTRVGSFFFSGIDAAYTILLYARIITLKLIGEFIKHLPIIYSVLYKINWVYCII